MNDNKSHGEQFAEMARAMFGRKENLTFLLIGRTGVGKSSTVNSLLGEDIAPTGKYSPTTMEVKTFKHKHGGLIYDVIDTPGLCDDLPEAGNDQIYLSKIKEQAKNADSVWFVSELDAARVTSDEKRGIKLITEALGSDCWEKSVIVFTRADKSDNFEGDLKERTKIVREEIGKYYGKFLEIPSVAVSNTSPVLPNGRQWLPELFTQVFLRFSDQGALPFLESMGSDIGAKKKPENTRATSDGAKETKDKSRIELDEDQKEKIRDSAFKRIVAGANAGAAIGYKIGKDYGKFGAAIGTGIGAVIGGIGGWLFN